MARFVDDMHEAMREQSRFFARVESAGETVSEARPTLYALAKGRAAVGHPCQARILRMAAWFIRA